MRKTFVVLEEPPEDEVVEPRPVCCSIPVCRRCGGHDPLSGARPVCHCGLEW